MIGTSIGVYRITAKLGAGGMGEVYRATDTKLKRDVALKVLPEAFARDPERLARFEREAEVLASLNHPNIATIHGVVEDRALVMELVEGSEPKGPLPFDEAWAIMSQVAAALDYAHEKGVVHRDLKPANIKVTPDGHVKLLDFGLAKAFSNQPDAQANPENSPTLTIGATRAGVILGTAAYMSPEQAKGRQVDKRADIWAFGVVLYELLTGQRLFKGEDVSETLAQVLTKEPDLNKVPAKIRRLLGRCFEKDPKKRLRDVGETVYLIDTGMESIGQEQLRPTTARPWMIAAGILGVAAMVLGFVSFRHMSEESPRLLKISVLSPAKAPFASTDIPAVSPDGRRIAFVATADGKGQLWVRDLDSIDARPLPGTEEARLPFWSPDSRFIGFFVDDKLKKTNVNGGSVATVCVVDTLAAGGTWSVNDVILFAPGRGGILRVPAAGGDATRVTANDKTLAEANHQFPWFLPDGHHFLFTAHSVDPEKDAIYVADLDSTGRHRVTASTSNAIYAAPGYVLFMRGQTLMGLRFDASKLQASGDPIPISENVNYVSGFEIGQFSASQNGVLAYLSGSSSSLQLTWFDRSGKNVSTVGPPGQMERPAISPDGAAVVVPRRDPQTNLYDLWMHDVARGTANRLTVNSGNNDSPVWSPDGKRIVFHSTRDGSGNVYQREIGGSTGDEPVDKTSGNGLSSRYSFPLTPDDWSRDGHYLIEESNPVKGFDLWVQPFIGDRKPILYLRNGFGNRFARLSPNGRWLAYRSNETKRDEVYVQAFPMPASKRQISTDGGTRPVWSHDGGELFFLSAAPGSNTRTIMTVRVKTDGAKFETSVPQPLFSFRASTFYFDVSKDGRFLIPIQAEQTTNVPMTVVVNWTAALKR